MRWLKFMFAGLLTLALIGSLLFPFGGSPPLGQLLNPFSGFWQNGPAPEPPRPEALTLAGLEAAVTVHYDERAVPHIFAANDHDLYFAQGYLTALDRLWQMEFQVRAAGGRLAEILGAGPDSVILNRDRRMRRLGMVYGAERSLTRMLEDPLTRTALEAYAAGINAYREQLTPATLPLEYKLLAYHPEPWEPLHTAIFLKNMSLTLAGGANDIEETQALAYWGQEVFDRLYPAFEALRSPIIPEPPPRPWYLRPLPDPVPPAPAGYHPDSLLLPFQPTPDRPDEIVGSNNWVIAGHRSRTGAPLLANDPHLGLSQPSIWYEIQLHGPDHSVYGVSFPGAPGVILGFNDSIAWGSTNSSRDVMDYYVLRFEGERRDVYYYDGRATPVSIRREHIAVKGGADFIDSVRYTILGPVLYDENYGDQPLPMALRWMAHEPSNELATFLGFNRARNYSDFKAALASYACPAQNFVFASAAGDIAFWQQGRFVDRWRGQGRFLLQAEERAHHWNAFIPQEDNPHLLNPPEGYIGTANQYPTGPAYPHYYGGRFETFRGRRLQQLLAAQDTFDLADMKRLQLDAYSMEAADLLPLLLADLDTTAFSPKDRQAYDLLRDWDYQYRAEAIAPTLFQLWWDDLYYGIWRDEIQAAGVPMDFPSRPLTIAMLHDSLTFSFYRSPGDTGVVTRPYLVNRAFNRVLGKLQNQWPEIADWQWGKWKTTSIRHLLRTLPSLGRHELPTDGYARTLNATSEYAGPSWRMVVALGPEVEAYGIYPGSQTGHPGSHRYGETIDDWQAGHYYRLWLLKGPADSRAPILHRQVLTPSPPTP